jgi:hypothetical protein
MLNLSSNDMDFLQPIEGLKPHKNEISQTIYYENNF